jgi:hypothetical protein
MSRFDGLDLGLSTKGTITAQGALSYPVSHGEPRSCIVIAKCPDCGDNMVYAAHPEYHLKVGGISPSSSDYHGIPINLVFSYLPTSPDTVPITSHALHTHPLSTGKGWEVWCPCGGKDSILETRDAGVLGVFYGLGRVAIPTLLHPSLTNKEHVIVPKSSPLAGLSRMLDIDI